MRTSSSAAPGEQAPQRRRGVGAAELGCGLRRLGFDVVLRRADRAAFLRRRARARLPRSSESANLAYFRRSWLAGSPDRVRPWSARRRGRPTAWASLELLDVAAPAEMLVNISGHLDSGRCSSRFRRRRTSTSTPASPSSGTRTGRLRLRRARLTTSRSARTSARRTARSRPAASLAPRPPAGRAGRLAPSPPSAAARRSGSPRSRTGAGRSGPWSSGAGLTA